MHTRLVALVRPDLAPPISRRKSKVPLPLCDVIATVSLPLPPPSSTLTDSTLLLLISTYLSHTLIALCRCLCTESAKHSNHEAIDLFSQTLHDSPTLLQWTPLCTQLSEKQCDSLLTRAYTSLISLSGKSSTSPEATFRIRNYALMCLLRTSGSTIESKTFWDQVVKSASSFAKSASFKIKGEERRLCRVVTSAFSELLALVEERVNRDEFLGGKPFISFCDAWISFSKMVCGHQYVLRRRSIRPGRRCFRFK
jgi:separase